MVEKSARVSAIDLEDKNSGEANVDDLESHGQE